MWELDADMIVPAIFFAHVPPSRTPLEKVSIYAPHHCSVPQTWLSCAGAPRPLRAPDTGSANLPAQSIRRQRLLAVSVYAAPELTRTVRVE